MERPVDMGGLALTLSVVGADEALMKLDKLREMIKEVNALIAEISSQAVEVSVSSSGDTDRCVGSSIIGSNISI